MKKTKSISTQAEKEAFLQQANQAYAAMQNDSKQWNEHLEELAIWDATLADGLDEI